MFPLRQHIPYIFRYISIGIAAVVIMTTTATSAAAAPRTWDGGSAADNNWQTPANWEGDVAPSAGDDLLFPAGVADQVTVNDFAAGTEFASITIAGHGYSISGNRVVLASTLSKTGGGDATVFLDITLKGGASGGPFVVTVSVAAADEMWLRGVISGADATPATLVKAGEGWLHVTGANTYLGQTLMLGGAIVAKHSQTFGATTAGTTVGDALIILEADIPAEPLTLDSSPTFGPQALACQQGPTCAWDGPIHIAGENTGVTALGGTTLYLNGVISGGNFRVASLADGIVVVSAPNTYVGTTYVGAGLTLNGSNRLPASTRVFVANVFDLNGHSQTVAGIDGGTPGEVKIWDGGTLTLDVPANVTATYDGKSSGAGNLVKTGEGTQTLLKTQAFTGVTTVVAGTLGFKGSMAGPVVVQGGTFRGIGIVKTLAATGGSLVLGEGPNADPTGAILTDALTLGPAATIEIDINGMDGADYDQVRVNGQVTLNNAKLQLNAHPDLTAIVSATIIDNQSALPVSGIFGDLPEGALITSNNKSFVITYTGGDGNDVVLKPAAIEYFLSEGATGPFFDLDILIANPNTVAANARLTFMLPDGSTHVEHRVVAPRSRMTVRVDDIAAVSETAVSTVVTSLDHLPLIVERTMRWGAGGYGAHTEQAVSGTAVNWYFAEGAQGFFSTYLLLANPQDAANVATVTYLRENAPAVVRMYPLTPKSRFTVDAGADPELVGRSFGMHVAFNSPGAAERSMYFGEEPLWKAGHESAGVTTPSETWILAEGATGSYFETFILMANPNDYGVTAKVTFLPSTGAPVEKQYMLAAFERRTLNIEAEDPALANAAVATSVDATGPIVVERAQYWPDPAPQWYEAHNSFGVTEARHKWGLAEGRVGGPEAYQTYILIANPSAATAHVTITFLRENGAPFEKTFTIEPRSRFNVDIGPGTLVPELTDESFGAIVTSADAYIVVERAMYSNANGQVWAAGTNATGAPLP